MDGEYLRYLEEHFGKREKVLFEYAKPFIEKYLLIPEEIKNPPYIIITERKERERILEMIRGMEEYISEGREEAWEEKGASFLTYLSELYPEWEKTYGKPVLLELGLRNLIAHRISPSSLLPEFSERINAVFHWAREKMPPHPLFSRVRKCFLIPDDAFNLKRESIEFFVSPYIPPSLFWKILEEVKVERMEKTEEEVKKEVEPSISLLLKGIEPLLMDFPHSAGEIIKRLERAKESLVLKEQEFRERKKKREIAVSIPEFLRKLIHLPELEHEVVMDILRESMPEKYTKGRLRREVDFDAFEQDYRALLDRLLPSIALKVLETMVRVWIPEKIILDEARYVGFKMRKKEVFFIPPKDYHEIKEEKWERIVAVLVYDIRGSSFMGEKLGCAKKESEIRNLFQERMAKVGRKYGAFLLKDTGDGGIFFFSENSDSLYLSYLSAREKGRYPEPQELIPGEDAGYRAVLCARDMVVEAEKFVKEHLEKYAEWFTEIEEKKIEFGGIVYQRLPPSYREIFRIGVGIAGGLPPDDVWFEINAFGDGDLTGRLVRDATLFSKAKHPERSVILADELVVSNFILRVESFEYEKEEKEEGMAPENPEVLFLHELFTWYRGGKNYKVKQARVKIERVMKEGMEYEGMRIGERKEGVDRKSGKVKSVYEILVT